MSENMLTFVSDKRTRDMEKNKMHITASQDKVIGLTFNEQGKKPYNRERSWIIAEAGGPQMSEDGREWFIGDFIAHIYRKGVFRFNVKFERIGNQQYVAVDHKKVK